MNKMTKWMTLALMTSGACAMVGCSSDGSTTYSVEDSFDIVLAKSSYTYKSKDSLLIVKDPVCKEVEEGGLKYLQWKKETTNPDSMIAYHDKTNAYLQGEDDDEEIAYIYDGSSFPSGNWVLADDNKNSIHQALVLSSGSLKKTFQYDGSCFMKSLYTQLFDKNSSLSLAESAIGKLYTMFSDDEDLELDEDEMVEDMRVPDCDELTMHDGDVSILVKQIKGSKGKILLQYKTESCPITFEFRYANNESDCKEAYDEYKLNRNTDKDFSFADYDRTYDYSYNCIADMVMQVKSDRASLEKSAAGEDKVKDAVVAAVDLVLSAFK